MAAASDPPTSWVRERSSRCGRAGPWVPDGASGGVGEDGGVRSFITALGGRGEVPYPGLTNGGAERLPVVTEDTAPGRAQRREYVAIETPT